MSSIINYKCSNEDCSLGVSLRINFPIWQDDTPMEMMKVPVMLHNKSYVLGYKSQSVCWGCNKIVDVLKDTNLCPDCGTSDKLLAEGMLCLKCDIGTVVVDNEGLNVCF